MGGPELRARDEVELLPYDAFGALIIGASGTGKSTLASALQEQGIAFVEPTATDRDRRPSELECPPCDHDFFSDQKFNDWRGKSWFVDTQIIYGSRYGVPLLEKPPAGAILLMIIKPVFVEPVITRYSNLVTYQIEASEATVAKRMQSRGQQQADIANRLRQHAAETAVGRRLADHVFRNEGQLQHTLQDLTARLRMDREACSPAQAVSEAPTVDATIELPYDATETFA